DAEVDLAVGLLVPGRLGDDVAAPAGVPAGRVVRVRAPAAVDAERVGIGERAARQVRAGRRRRTVVVAAEVQARGAGEVVAVVGPVQELAEHLAPGAAGGLGGARVRGGEPALVVPGRLEVVGVGVDRRLAVDQVVDGQRVGERGAGDHPALDL